MPLRSENKLGSLIQKAINDKEIEQALQDGRLNKGFLTDQITYENSMLWAVALEDIQQYDITENEIADIKNENPNIFSPNAETKLDNDIQVANGFGVFSIWLFLSIVISAIVYYFNHNTLLEVYIIMKGKLIFLILISLLAISFSLYIVLYNIYKNRKKKWQDDKNELDKTKNFNILENRLLSLEKEIDTKIIDKAIKPQMRAIINKSLQPSYDNQLNNIEAEGLSEILNPSQTIDTIAQSSLSFLFNNMTGGSIGIAGPRGAGKSTLIQNYCGPQRSIERIKDKRILPIFTSAPVEYDTRDFILHLFAISCKSLLKQEGVQSQTNNIGDIQNQTNAKNNLFSIGFLQVLRNTSFIFGIIFISLSYIILLINHPGLFGLPITTNRTNIFTILAVEPGPLMKWGIILILLSYFIQKIIGGSWAAYIIDFIKNSLLLKPFRNFLQKIKTKHAEENLPTSINQKSPITELAEQLLQKIKFQQTFTSGWTGALKSPIGLEGTVNSAMTFAEKQMSNPEIVNEFTQFLTDIPLDYQIVIGIDELDKLESDEKAQKFLNEIKSIFGLKRCFYLISISENAMSNFERRGLPFRDAFDSSFDSIIYVNYLNLDESTTLLERRVIGKPMPFFYLSYCLSGGLPRDLIRYFRQIIEIRSKNPKINTLNSITELIIDSEIKSKMRAVIFVAKKYEMLLETKEFAHFLFALQSGKTTTSILINWLKEFNEWQNKLSTKSNVPEKLQPLYEGILALGNEIYSYIFLMSTLLGFFTDNLEKEKIVEAKKGGHFDNLALAKQAMASNPFITKTIIQDFRNLHNMTPL